MPEQRLQNPVIVIPGITASTLRDEYEVEAERVWAMLRRSYDRVALHPDNLLYEQREPSRVRADGVFEVPYEEMIKDLRHDLSPRGDQPTPVFPFAYDWRQPLEDTEDRLHGFIDEVIERTALLPHYYEAGYHGNASVNLVGHSMGGLIIAGYLARYGGDGIGKVATVGTPFRGSLEAPLKITTGLSTLGRESASREREVARLTPSLYYLTPEFEGAINAPDTLPQTLFDGGLWQPSVTETLTEYLELYGQDRSLPKGQQRTAKERRDHAKGLLAGILSGARSHLKLVESLSLESVGLDSSRWLCVVGVGEETRLRLTIKEVDGAPRFDLAGADRDNDWTPRRTQETTRTGDGTVPYLGARASFIPTNELVCVSGHDFGYWEIADKVLKGPLGVGLHGMLPEMNVVQKLIVAHFKEASHAGVFGRRAPDLPLDAAWKPPIPGLSKREKLR